jgi:hypothetical protein
LVATALVSCTAQDGDDESSAQNGESPECNDESQTDLPAIDPRWMFDRLTPVEKRDLATVAEQRGI